MSDKPAERQVKMSVEYVNESKRMADFILHRVHGAHGAKREENEMKIYLAGPMSNIPHFNYPAFNSAAAALRFEGHEVFNPAEHDMEMFGKDISNPTGDAEQATSEHGFDRRAALKADLSWICDKAEAIALLPGWEKSSGANAERALAVALNLEVLTLREGDPS